MLLLAAYEALHEVTATNPASLDNELRLLNIDGSSIPPHSSLAHCVWSQIFANVGAQIYRHLEIYGRAWAVQLCQLLTHQLLL